MNKKNEWIEFFKYEASQYEEEVFTKNTAFEIEFLVKEFNLPSSSRILDIGCGIGRHSLGLAKKGYQMTGVDISPDMLAIARQKAELAGLNVEWIEMDAKQFQAEKQYDAAICLCEGALCLLGSEDDPFERDKQVLSNIFNALKPGTMFIVNALNAFRMVCQLKEEDFLNNSYDLNHQIENSVQEFTMEDGEVVRIPVRERHYTPAEFIRVLQDVGFVVEHLWGGTAGAWNKELLKVGEYEMMAVARKPAD